MNQPSKASKLRRQQNLKQWGILGLLLIVIIAGQSYAMYTIFTSQFPGANDFFVRWLGGREYLLNGTNPFDDSIAEQAQMAMFGRLATPEDKDEAYFAYPLYTLYFFWPLSLMSYAWAQAIWMTLLQFMLLGSTLIALRLSGWRPPTWLFWVTIFWGIFFYNGARAILLGQFSILVALALMLALWAIHQRHDVWAGVFLAVTTIKPQMVFLIIVFLMLWALTQGRWRLIFSSAGSLLLLVLSSMLLVPSWPLDFYYNAIAYSDYVAFGTPLENLLHYLLPANIAAPLTPALSGLLFLTLLPGWIRALRGHRGAYTWAVMSTLIVGSLITFRSATTNQVILYLPLFFFFYRLSFVGEAKQQRILSDFETRFSVSKLYRRVRHRPLALFDTPRTQFHLVGTQNAEGNAAQSAPSSTRASRSNWLPLAIMLGLALFMWTAFALTIEGNWEHVMMHGLLPALMVLLYAADYRGLWAAAVRYEIDHPTPEPADSQPRQAGQTA